MNSTVIVDNGTHTIKTGFSGDDLPYFEFDTIVGYFCAHGFTIGIKDYYFGKEAILKKSILKLKYPIERGVIINYDCIELIWRFLFLGEKSLNKNYIGWENFKQPICDAKDSNILFTESHTNTKSNREKTTEIMFENFNLNSFYLANQSVLSLYSYGRLNGTVVQTGGGITEVVPIYQGYKINHCVSANHLAGADVSNYLNKLIDDKFDISSYPNHQKFINDIKSNICFTSLDFDKDCKLKEKHMTTYTLPDGQPIEISDESFKSTEIFFKPHILGMKMSGIHETTLNCIMKCDKDIKRELFRNIIVGGGGTMFNSFGKRLENEIKIKMNKNNVKMANDVKVFDLPERNYSTWIGGSIFSSLSTFNDFCISKSEYDEIGSKVVNYKCY